MTQMIYRPRTNERHIDRKPVHKVIFRDLPCDALVINESEIPAYESKGWFSDPNDMIKPKAKSSKPKAKVDESGE